MRKLATSFQDLMARINDDYVLIEKVAGTTELWYKGSDWGMTEAEKEAAIAGLEDGGEYSYSDHIGTLQLDPSGNITALKLNSGYQGYSLLMQLSAFLIRDAQASDAYISNFDLEMEPDGHLIRITVIAEEVYFGDDEDGTGHRYVVGQLAYDSRTKALLAS